MREARDWQNQYSPERRNLFLATVLRWLCVLITAMFAGRCTDDWAVPVFGQEVLPREPSGSPPRKFPEVLGGAIQPDAFYTVDKNGFRIMLPGMTFEEIDRLQKAAGGYIQTTKPYTFERVTIDGTADDSRADLTITFVINFSSASGNRVIVPLQMKGFHIQGPADVVGVEEYGFDFLPSLGGHLLWVRPDQPRSIEVRMRAVSRVNSDNGPGFVVDLPPAPTTLRVDVRGVNLDAFVVGRGDEVVEVASAEQARTKIQVECSGGAFTLNWRTRGENRPSDQVLEATSRIRLNWDDPQSPPNVIAELEVTNRRGALSTFEVRLPEGAELIEPIQNASGVQISIRDLQGGQIQVIPTEGDQIGRVKFALEYRLPSRAYDAEQPLVLQSIEVPAAVRHSGDLEIRTDRNYRVRWLQSSLVRSVRRTVPAVETTDPRIYLFQFDRAGFELPIWLSTKRQPVRVDPEYSIVLDESSARLQARLIVSGTLLEGLPLIVDTSDWKTTLVQDLESGREVVDPLNSSGESLELELAEATVGMNNQFGFLWTAERSIDAGSGNVRFPLPILRTLDDRAILISPGNLTVRCQGGIDVFVDYEKSEGLIQVQSPLTPGSSDDDDRLRFRLQTVGGTPVFHGYFVDSPPEANIDSTVEFSVGTTNQLRTIVDWMVTPKDDLRGQLPVRLNGFSETETSVEEGRSRKWQVTVNGQVAALRSADGSTGLSADAIIYSDQLTREPVRIQWSLTKEFPEVEAQDGVEIEVALPFPALPLTNQNALCQVRIVEEAGFKLNLVHRDEATTGPLDLIGDSDVQLTILPRTATPEKNAILRNALVRSEIGRQRRFDRLLAEVSGDGSFLQVAFAGLVSSGSSQLNNGTPVVEVEVDGEMWELFRTTRDGLEISLPETGANRRVDIRVWNNVVGTQFSNGYKPAFLLPLSTGKTYWDLVLSTDRHLIWNTPSASPLMVWRYDRMMIQRVPTRSYAELVAMFGGEAVNASVPGNRYLFITADATALKVYAASRAMLWLTIGGAVLLVATVIMHVPAVRNPFSALIGAAFIGGVAWNTPDVAVIAGQLTLVAIALVAIMLGVKSILARRPRATILGGVVEESSQPVGSANRPKVTEPASTRLPDVVMTGSTAGTQS